MYKVPEAEAHLTAKWPINDEFPAKFHVNITLFPFSLGKGTDFILKGKQYVADVVRIAAPQQR